MPHSHQPPTQHLIHRRTLLKRMATTAAGVAASTLLPELAMRPASAADLRAARPLPARDVATLAAIAGQFMQQFRAPGLSVAIARGGAFLYQQGFGYADETGQKVTLHHLFRIASVTKTLTSTTLFSLIEQGRLKLDDFVFGPKGHLGHDYGASYPAVVNQITVHHLLTHTGGGWGNTTNDPMFSSPQLSQRQLIAWTIQNRPLEYVPGTHYDYSNFGYCVLGRLIEKLTGQSYVPYVQKQILAHCGATMRLATNQRSAGEVRYFGQDGQNPYGFNISRMDSHGGWIATPSDLVRFAARVDGFSHPADILRPRTLQTMITPCGANPSYACGWNVNGAPNWWHMGSLPGTNSIVVRTQSGFCWAALTNTRSEGIGPALDQMMWQMVQSVPAWWK